MDPHDPRGWRLGGAAPYAALTAARLGVRVACVLGLGPGINSAEELGFLLAAGVEIRPVPLRHGPVFENTNVSGARVQRWHSRSDPLHPAALPIDWADAAGWLFAPVAGEVEDDWARVPNQAAVVGLGWQGLLRRFVADGAVEPAWPSPSALLERADVIVASQEDLPGDATLCALAGLLRPGARLIITAGNRGGLVIDGHHLACYPAVREALQVDPVGAGDVFIAALLSAALLTGDRTFSGRALHVAAAAAACSVEGVGLSSVPSGPRIARCLRQLASS